jgi:hypothetical protein
MKSLIKSLTLCLLISTASAARLENVKFLEVKTQKNSVKLKLQISDGPEDSYFFVEITKSDEASFEKLSLVLEKQKSDKSVQIDLDIPSFSVFPSGSSYKSESVKFFKIEKAKEEKVNKFDLYEFD